MNDRPISSCDFPLDMQLINLIVKHDYIVHVICLSVSRWLEESHHIRDSGRYHRVRRLILAMAAARRNLAHREQVRQVAASRRRASRPRRRPCMAALAAMWRGTCRPHHQLMAYFSLACGRRLRRLTRSACLACFDLLLFFIQPSDTKVP